MWVFFKKFDLELSLFFVGLAQLKKYSLITRTRIIYKRFQKLKDLAKLFPRDVEEKQIRGVEDSGRKSNKAVFHIL